MRTAVRHIHTPLFPIGSGPVGTADNGAAYQWRLRISFEEVQRMTDNVKTILDKAATTASDFHEEMKACREVLLASAPMIEVTEEMSALYWKAINVLVESDFDTETLEHIADLIGSEGANDVRWWRQ